LASGFDDLAGGLCGCRLTCAFQAVKERGNEALFGWRQGSYTGGANHYMATVAAEFLEADVAFTRAIFQWRGRGAVVTSDGGGLTGEIEVLNGFSIEFHLDVRSREAYAHPVPFLRFVELFDGCHGTIEATGELRVFCLGIVTKVRHLHFEAVEGGIALHGRAEGEAGIAAGSELEFVFELEVRVGFLADQPAAAVPGAGEDAVLDLPDGGALGGFADVGPMPDDEAGHRSVFCKERSEGRIFRESGRDQGDGGEECFHGWAFG
jgi:hypothetical protein